MNDIASYVTMFTSAANTLDLEVPKEVLLFTAEHCMAEEHTRRHYDQLDHLLAEFRKEDGEPDPKRVMTGETAVSYQIIDALVVQHGFWWKEFYGAQMETERISPSMELDTYQAIGAAYSELTLPTEGPRRWIHHNLGACVKMLRKARELHDQPSPETALVRQDDPEQVMLHKYGFDRDVKWDDLFPKNYF